LCRRRRIFKVAGELLRAFQAGSQG
jgi:hypothetical protein